MLGLSQSEAPILTNERPVWGYLGTQSAVISASSLKVSSPRPQVSVTEMQKKMKKTGNLQRDFYINFKLKRRKLYLATVFPCQ